MDEIKDWNIGRKTSLDNYKGGTRKIGDEPPRPCSHPEHNPAGMVVREPGIYEHTCPGCGQKQIFTVTSAWL